MSQTSIRLLPEALRSITGVALTSSYQAIGTPLANPSRILWIQNLTDVQVLISLNGTTDHMILAVNGFVIIDITANKSNIGGGTYIAQGTTVYAKEVTNATTGSVYVSTFYAVN